MAGRFGESLISRLGILRLVVLWMILCLPLFFSCRGFPDAVPEDPFAVLSFSSDGGSPAAFFVLPPEIMTDLLRENAGFLDRASDVKTLEDFFSRASNVSAVLFYDENTGGFALKLLASGNFPKTRFNLSLNASSGWERFDAVDVTCFKSGNISVSVPSSGIFAAVFSSGNNGEGSAHLADILNALSRPGISGIAEIPPSFESVASAAVSDSPGTPMAFYSGSASNLLPVFSGFMQGNGASGSALPLDLKGFKVPFGPVEIYIRPEAEEAEKSGDRLYTLDVTVEASSGQTVIPAVLFLQMAMPDAKITRDGKTFFIEKKVSGKSIGLAVFSFFLVSYL